MTAPNRYYSSTAGLMVLTAPISGLDTVITVDTTAGIPASVPFTILLAPGTNAEEIATVTSVSGLTLTVIRGEDGTVGVSHPTAAQVIHGGTARDLREAQAHIAASQAVHGLGGGSSVVGTTDSQTLTNKTMSGSANTFTNIPLSALPGDTATTDTTQTFTNKTLTAPATTVLSNTGGLTTDTVHATGGSTIGGNETVAGTLAVTGATTLAAVSATGVSNSGNGTVAGTFGVTGAATVGGTLGVTGALTAGSVSTGGNAVVSGAAQVTGDVTAAHFNALSMTPTLSFQVSDAAYGATGSWQDFGSTPWPAFTFVVPPSGRVRIDVTATLSNNNTSTSTIGLSFKMGAPSESITAPGSGTTQTIYQDSTGVIYSAAGAGRSARTQFEWASTVTVGGARQTVSHVMKLTAGETITLTPQYRISTGNSGTAATSTGVITVTPLI